MQIEQLARRAHEANRIICCLLGEEVQAEWESAPEWQKQSAISGVKFHIDNPNSPPSASHYNWLMEKKRDGWKYGPVKNPERKLHPCMVPYEELPLQQRLKDYMFILMVTGEVHTLPKSDPYYRCDVTLLNGIQGMLRDVVEGVSHSKILSNWDKVRGAEWFTDGGGRPV